MTELREKMEAARKRYHEIIGEFDDPEVREIMASSYGLLVDDHPLLWGLCMAVVMSCKTADEAAHEVQRFLADSWLLNIKWEDVIGPGDWPIFPYEYGSVEFGRWNLPIQEKKPIHLDTLLSHRIGICLSYAFTLGIVLKVAGLADKICLLSAMPPGPEAAGHLWVEATVENEVTYYDLARRGSFIADDNYSVCDDRFEL